MPVYAAHQSGRPRGAGLWQRKAQSTRVSQVRRQGQARHGAAGPFGLVCHKLGRAPFVLILLGPGRSWRRASSLCVWRDDDDLPATLIEAVPKLQRL